MTADEPVAGVPRLCARRADCTRPRGHDDECGPDRADTELAHLRAEVEALREEAREMQSAVTELAPSDEVLVCGFYFPRADLPRVLRNYMRAESEASSQAKSERIKRERAVAERDAALARLAEAEGVARTNAAWVRQQHAAAKEVREQRDALQRQVDAVRALHTLVDSTVRGRRLKHAVCAEDAARMPCPTLAALDVVEPADQPHPTPEAEDICPCSTPGWTHLDSYHDAARQQDEAGS